MIIKFITCIVFSSILFTSPLKYAKNHLSEYNFFTHPLKNQIPTNNVFAYSVASPLFTDYAYKKRFIYVPDNSTLTLKDDGHFIYPQGTVLIKNFYYPHDFNKSNNEVRIMETRLLIKTMDDWVALPYIWNEEQTDAVLEIAGDRLTASWKHYDGKHVSTEYVVPNMNQCKGCHVYKNNFQPIGPTIKNLNYVYTEIENPKNQIDYWIEVGILEPTQIHHNFSTAIDYRDPHESIDSRARAWLDVNCAHCHRLGGPAENTGLYLELEEKDNKALGIMKPPIAAGRGSGNLKYTIVPGKPHGSILSFRINSTDPGIMMPELGRKLVHKEGLEIINRWIKEMDYGHQ